MASRFTNRLRPRESSQWLRVVGHCTRRISIHKRYTFTHYEQFQNFYLFPFWDSRTVEKTSAWIHILHTHTHMLSSTNEITFLNACSRTHNVLLRLPVVDIHIYTHTYMCVYYKYDAAFYRISTCNNRPYYASVNHVSFRSVGWRPGWVWEAKRQLLRHLYNYNTYTIRIRYADDDKNLKIKNTKRGPCYYYDRRARCNYVENIKTIRNIFSSSPPAHGIA